MDASTPSIDPQRRLGHVVLGASVSGDAFVAAMKALYEAPEWQPGFRALWDLRAVTELLVAPADIEAMVTATRALDARMGTGRAAFVVQRDIEGLIARLLVVRTASPRRERRVFDTVEAARAWLDAE